MLARKKRGFGVGKLTGIGGKPEPGERIEETNRREIREEIGVEAQECKRVATFDFFFPHMPARKGWDQQACVYLVHAWYGDPRETDEMAPQWFPTDDLPLADLWADNRIWLPRVLQGEYLTSSFLFDESNDGLEAYSITSLTD